jgi:hypothetical protein
MVPHGLRHFAVDFLHTAELTFSASRSGQFGDRAASLDPAINLLPLERSKGCRVGAKIFAEQKAFETMAELLRHGAP